MPSTRSKSKERERKRISREKRSKEKLKIDQVRRNGKMIVRLTGKEKRRHGVRKVS